MEPAVSKRPPKNPVRPPQPEPQRANRSRAVAELLPAIGGAAFRRFGFVQSAIVSRWPDIVGERWANVSRPESLRFPIGEKRDGTLSLIVKGAHAPMMQHIVPEIAERVNRFFGYTAVARVQIRQGEVSAREPRRAPPSLKPAPAEMSGGLRTIADPELRAVLESLAAGVAASAGVPRIG
ncbi:DUF721 domain-containing protein [Sphingomonas sp.]|uniref:DUF721 domain-containing protein n=1 Tax=Sphingomonas sp. TaxID=28214 RepID=UPI003B00E8EA